VALRVVTIAELRLAVLGSPSGPAIQLPRCADATGSTCCRSDGMNPMTQSGIGVELEVSGSGGSLWGRSFD
jgi:hypothetical protein